MKRYILAPIIALFIAAIILVNPSVTAAATQYSVAITVVGTSGSPIPNASVILYDTSGMQYTGTTDSNGVATIAVPATGTYLIEVNAGNYIILDTVNVASNTSYTVDATKMKYANITSTPIAVNASVVLGAFNTVQLTQTTNITVYAPSNISITFPSEIPQTPFKYTFSKVVYNGIESNQTTVSIDMTSNYAVTAYYTRTFYLPLGSMNYWMVAILIIIIVAAIAIAWSSGARTAKTMIDQWMEENRRFVRRKEEEE